METVRIAVCDDEAEVLNLIADRVQQCCADWGEVFRYTDSTALLEDSRKTVFDVLLLDIEMPGLDGMALAEKIREENPYVAIVFITNKEDCVFRAYRYGTFRFIRKAYLDEELEAAVADLKAWFDAKSESIVLQRADGQCAQRIQDIRYIEVQGHTLTIHCADDAYQAAGTMKDFDKALSEKGFIRIHKSYLVNFRYIYLVGTKDVQLTDGSLLPLSRNRIRETQMKLQIFTRSMRL